MAQSSASVLYFDGNCPDCRRAAHLIERLDWLRKLDTVSFRHDDSFLQAGILPADLEKAMHLVTDRRVLVGFSAVIAICRRLPLLWPALPALWLVGLTGAGDKLYSFLAARRIIVADPSACKTDRSRCG